MGKDRLTQIQPDFRFDDVEGRAELDIANVVSAEIDVHQTGDLVAGFRLPIVLDPLDERGGTIADPDDGHPDLLLPCHAGLPVSPTVPPWTIRKDPATRR